MFNIYLKPLTNLFIYVKKMSALGEVTQISCVLLGDAAFTQQCHAHSTILSANRC